jgi:hypothetical protein
MTSNAHKQHQADNTNETAASKEHDASSNDNTALC